MIVYASQTQEMRPCEHGLEFFCKYGSPEPHEHRVTRPPVSQYGLADSEPFLTNQLSVLASRARLPANRAGDGRGATHAMLVCNMRWATEHPDDAAG